MRVSFGGGGKTHTAHPVVTVCIFVCARGYVRVCVYVLPPFVGWARYANFSDALNATGRPILFSLCEWGKEDVESWGGEVAQMFRVQEDHVGAPQRCPFTVHAVTHVGPMWLASMLPLLPPCCFDFAVTVATGVAVVVPV